MKLSRSLMLFALISVAALCLAAAQATKGAVKATGTAPGGPVSSLKSLSGALRQATSGRGAHVVTDAASTKRAGDEKSSSSPRSTKLPATIKTSGGGSAGNTKSSGFEQALESSIANAKVELSGKDMATAAGHHHYGGGGGGKHGHGKYYMYAESPKKGAYSMGFKRGNHKHMIERKESSHKGHVHSYFKWHDKKGKGSHKFEYKHYDKKSKHHGHY